MKTKSNVSALRRLALAVFAAMTCHLSGAGYLKFEGVEGESTDSSHEGWCDILSMGQSITRSKESSASGRVRERAIVDDLVVVKELDKSSPKLMEAVCMGTGFPEVIVKLAATTPDGKTRYYQYTLKNVVITSYSIGGSADGSVPSEKLSLNYEEITWTYTTVEGSEEPTEGPVYSWKVEEGVS